MPRSMAETLQFIAKAFKAHCRCVLRDLCAICSILLAVQTLLYSYLQEVTGHF
jgi:hypothetical protein